MDTDIGNSAGRDDVLTQDAGARNANGFNRSIDAASASQLHDAFGGISVGGTVAVAPSPLATCSRLASGSTMMISAGESNRAVSNSAKPMGPNPTTATVPPD